MSGFKPKRLITHKDLEKMVEVRRLGSGGQLPLHKVLIYVYYTKHESPLETGKTGIDIDIGNEGSWESKLGNRVPVWTVNVGEWLEGVLSKGIMPRKPNNVSKEQWVEAVWTGNLDVLPVPQLRLTQEQKKEVRAVLYSQINHNGTLALYEEEERLNKRSDEEKEREERMRLMASINTTVMSIEEDLYSRFNLQDVDTHHRLDLTLNIEGATIEELRNIEQGVKDVLNT